MSVVLPASADALAVGSMFSERYGAPVISWAAELLPVALHRARSASHGGRSMTYMVDEDRVYRGNLRQLWALDGFGADPIDGPLAVICTFAGDARDRLGRPRRAPDLSNLLKAVEDAANPEPRGGPWRGLWHDDSQIKACFGHITGWGPGVAPGVGLHVWRVS